MAGGFESSGFKNTFGVEKRSDGSIIINYKAYVDDNPGFFKVFLKGLLICLLLSFFAFLIVDWYMFPTLIISFIYWAYSCHKVQKNLQIVIHTQGIEFLGKKLAFTDIKSTGTISYGGGTVISSVGGNVTSSTSRKTFTAYANAFGQDVNLTYKLREPAIAEGILEVIRQAMRGETIQAQEWTEHVEGFAFVSKAINWFMNNKAAKWGLAILVIFILFSSKN